MPHRPAFDIPEGMPPNQWLVQSLTQAPVVPSMMPTVLQREPDALLSRWGFLQFPDTPEPFTLIFGNRYPISRLDALYDQAQQHIEQIMRVRLRAILTPSLDLIDAPDPNDEMIMRLLMMNPADRRMTYRSLLHWETLTEDSRSHEQSGDPFKTSLRYIALMMETDRWQRLDMDEMQAKLGSGLEWSLFELKFHRYNDCWRWLLPLVPGHATPTTPSWRGMKHVAAHRLLWPIMKPELPFKLGGRPTRHPRLCADPICVNPNHFLDPTMRVKRMLQGPGRGYTGAVRSGNNIPWNLEDVRVRDDGTRELRCPRCGEAGGYRQQEAVNLPEGIAPTSGKMYCWNCQRLYKQAIAMFTRPNATRMPNEKRMETEIERQEREFRESQDDGWPEWTRDWGKNNPADPA